MELAGTLWMWGISPYCYKVRLAAAYKGVTLHERILGLSERERARRETGSPKVPVVETPQGWITDSTAILRWLEGASPTPSLYPADPPDRAEDALLEDWADEALGAAVEPWIWAGGGRLATLNALCVAEQPRWSGRAVMRGMRPLMRRMWQQRLERFGGVDGGRAQVVRQLDLLAARLGEGPWLFGAAPSASDFAVAGQLLNLIRFGCSDDLDARPHLAAMVRRAGAMLPEVLP